MRREAKIAKLQQLYLYDQYNVSAFQIANSQIHNFLARIINSLLEGINKHRLPRFIVMLVDNDLLKGMKSINKPDVSKLIGNCLSWITKQVELIVEIKREEIYSKRIGALQLDEPKIVWIKMLERPNATADEGILWHKYNDILEETIVSRKNNLILDVKNAMQKGPI